jgi:predicted transcriptional regulator
MRISEVVEKTGLTALNEWDDGDVGGVYISDMVSDIITAPVSGCILVTLQTHTSLIAAANLVDAGMVVIAHGKQPTPDVVGLADKAAIPLFSTADDTWTYALKLVDLGMR